MHRSLQEDDEGRTRTTAHAHPALRHVEAARQPARQLQTTQQNPCLAFGKGFFQLFSGAAGRQQTFKKKVALHGKPDPGPPRGGAGGPVVPAASSRDPRGGVQRRTEVVRARGVQARGLEDWKGLSGSRSPVLKKSRLRKLPRQNQRSAELSKWFGQFWPCYS